MRDILNELDRWQEEGEEIALATLVDSDGPSPWRIGAHLFITRSGKMIGSVSGGCVDNDVLERAIQVLETGQPEIQRYGISDELGIAVGLSCGGSIDVLIETWRNDDLWQALHQAIRTHRPVSLCTALSPDALRGRKLVVLGDQDFRGSIDPGLDATIATDSRKLLLDGKRRVIEYPYQGGESRIFVNSFPPTPRLFIVGATQIAMPLCRMAVELEFRVSVVDPRSPFATEERFPMADELLRMWPDEAFDEASLDPECFVLTLTHDPKFDIPTLARALRTRVRYIGALGSRRTHERRKGQLREQGFTDVELDRIHTPIGLDIGARTPEEIALAILAELVAVRYERDARSSIATTAPVHTRGE